MNRVTQRLNFIVVLFLLSSCNLRAEQTLEVRVNAFVSLIDSCAEYVETGSPDAFSMLTQVPLEPQDCLFGCDLGAARYVSPDAPDAGYLVVKNSGLNGSRIGEVKLGAASMPQEARCLIEPADNLDRTYESELNNAVQEFHQTALDTRRIFASDQGHYWNEGCGHSGLTYEVETITIGVHGSNGKYLHFVQFHYPALYYEGPTDLHGFPLGPEETKTCEEVGF